jgi:hypothetical protein
MRETTDPDTPSGERILLDAEGNRTDDPAKAERGELAGRDEQDRSPRTRFFFDEVEIKWLPVSESAFLLWVLAGLLGAWLLIGVLFGLV